MNDKYKISTIITIYNHENYLDECLNSVINQNGEFDHEIIIANDCSTDGSQNIINKYKTLYPTLIKQLENSKNLGLLKNMQRAFDKSTGDFIAICEGDDYWCSSEKLQKQLNFLLENKNFPMCFNKMFLLTEYSNDYSVYIVQEAIKKNYVTFEDFIIHDLANFSSCFYRKESLKLIPFKYFEEDPALVADWLFNLCILYNKNVGFLNEELSVYRLHSNGQWTGLPLHEKYCKINESYKLFYTYFPDKFEIIKKAENRSLLNTTIINKSRKNTTIMDLNIKKNKNSITSMNNMNNIYNYTLQENTEVLKRKKSVNSMKKQSVLLRKSRRSLKKMVLTKKLNIGCGDTGFGENWINVDKNKRPLNIPQNINYLMLNVLKSFPFENIELIYCEHFIEHLTKQNGILFIRNCFNSLKKNGILRIATFDLQELMDNAHSSNIDWKKSCEAVELGWGHLTKCEFINMAFNGWGHNHVYNQDDLIEIFQKGGFTNIKKCSLNISEHPDLCNRETRFNSRLIVEGQK